MPRENRYQPQVIRRLERDFPGCVVLKNDAEYLPGIPDLIVLLGIRWAMLETKRSADAPFQPNQPYYIDLLNRMSFCAVIFPENEDEVFDALQFALKPRRTTRLPKR